MTYNLIIIALIFTLTIVLSVGLVIYWSRKQDEINNLTFFCIRHLVQSSSIDEKCHAAEALAQAHNPVALLVLVAIINDKELGEERVRVTALEALKSMSSSFKRYKKFFNLLIPAIENRDHSKIVGLLIDKFEKRGKPKYVQSAYAIGREYIYLERYQEAKQWLERAESRRNETFYCTNEIDDLVELCNVKLYEQCDTIYHQEKYFQALECYSLTTHSLDDDEKHRFRSHLRIACTYCKLQRYSDAKQALLYALQHHEKTDYALKLNNLLDELPDVKDEALASSERDITSKIDQYVNDIMDSLNDGLKQN